MCYAEFLYLELLPETVQGPDKIEIFVIKFSFFLMCSFKYVRESKCFGI